MLLRAPLLASLLLALAAPAVTAVSTIPDEGAVELPGDRTVAAMVGDVNGDGVRELVRLVPWSTNPGQQAVEVVTVADGVAETHQDVPLERAATPDDTFAGRRPSPDNLLPLGITEPARLIAWHEGGRERVLVATIGAIGLAPPCCLTLWRVGLDGDATTVQLIQASTSISAAAILAADMDGDGTDELVVAEHPAPDLEPFLFHRPILVMRWDGEAFGVMGRTEDQSASIGPLMTLGDTDGRAGVEVGFQGSQRFDQNPPALTRVRLGEDGSLQVDAGELPDVGEVAPIATEDGGRLALVNSSGSYLLNWRAGEAMPVVVTSSWRGGQLLGVVGSGFDVALLVVRGGAVDVLDSELTSRQSIAADPSAARFVAAGEAPYEGPLDGGFAGDDATALIFRGRLITSPSDAGPAASPRFVTAGYIADLAGASPIGLIGPGRGWVAIARSGPHAAPDRAGGALEAPGVPVGSVWIVPTEAMLSPALDGGDLTPRFHGGVLDATRRVPTLLTAGTMSATVEAPVGSRVRLVSDRGQQSTVAELSVGDAGILEVAIAENETGGAQFSVDLRVTTPAGVTYGGRWQVRVVQHSPRLSLEADGLPLSFDVGVRGTTEPGVVVEVDGHTVAVAPDGAFEASVGGGILPRDVPVRATDQLGNVTQETISVVALADYRLLPWVPITAVVTVGLGLFLYLRTPRSARPSGSTGTGTLEEID